MIRSQLLLLLLLLWLWPEAGVGWGDSLKAGVDAAELNVLMDRGKVGLDAVVLFDICLENIHDHVGTCRIQCLYSRWEVLEHFYNPVLFVRRLNMVGAVQSECTRLAKDVQNPILVQRRLRITAVKQSVERIMELGGLGVRQGFDDV